MAPTDLIVMKGSGYILISVYWYRNHRGLSWDTAVGSGNSTRRTEDCSYSTGGRKNELWSQTNLDLTLTSISWCCDLQEHHPPWTSESLVALPPQSACCSCVSSSSKDRGTKTLPAFLSYNLAHGGSNWLFTEASDCQCSPSLPHGRFLWMVLLLPKTLFKKMVYELEDSHQTYLDTGFDEIIGPTVFSEIPEVWTDDNSSFSKRRELILSPDVWGCICHYTCFYPLPWGNSPKVATLVFDTVV